MTAEEYAQLVLAARDTLFDAIRAALPDECEMEKRFIQTGEAVENQWTAALVNKETDSIRLFVLLMTNLTDSPAERTAGGKNFKPQVRLFFELFHDQLQGTDGENSQDAFDSDALKIQFAIAANKSLPPKGYIESHNFSLGSLRSNRPLHYGRGEIVINFREIRYE